jgi:hypothetical protein
MTAGKTINRPNELRPRWRMKRDGLRPFAAATLAAASVDSTLVLTGSLCT